MMTNKRFNEVTDERILKVCWGDVPKSDEVCKKRGQATQFQGCRRVTRLHRCKSIGEE